MTDREKAIKALKEFLLSHFNRKQTFSVRNLVGDPMTTVYSKNGITVDYCPNWDYLEVFGLTESEYWSLSEVVHTC